MKTIPTNSESVARRFSERGVSNSVRAWQSSFSRRSFLRKGVAAGAAAAATGLFVDDAGAESRGKGKGNGKGGLPKGDAAILRFLAAAEILETDAWQQYNELCGIQDNEVPGGSGNPAFTDAVS